MSPGSARLVLASGSPRRLELLRLAGYDPVVRPADIDEEPRPNEAPGSYVIRLAREKAAAVPRADGEVVLAADTTVVLEGRILGKPTDARDAAAMLRSLAARTHEVQTAVVVAGADGTDGRLVRTAVTFGPLDNEQIAAYVATGEPLDKAGAYGIQGAAQVFVAGIQGSWTNVVGLPVVEAVGLLRAAGAAPSAQPST